MITPQQEKDLKAKHELNGLLAGHISRRPKLTAEAVGEYLDWITENISSIPGNHLAVHMQACELVIRTRATDAQAKATQHTLVESGVIDQPNA
jgi:hypothetical protein